MILIIEYHYEWKCPCGCGSAFTLEKLSGGEELQCESCGAVVKVDDNI